jgi:hypothetical protein
MTHLRTFRYAPFISSVALALATLLSACADDYGQSCDMPDSASFRAACDSDEAGNDGTCLFRNSPECDTRLCGRYLGEGDFCTQECDIQDPASCPSDSVCFAAANRASNAFCVPNSVIESAENPETAAQ